MLQLNFTQERTMYSNIHMPQGFTCSGTSAGIKKSGGLDMALILSEQPASVAGVFTTNQVCAAPVKVCREHLKRGTARAVVLNSGIANACTGAEGMEASLQMATKTAARIGCDLTEVFVSSTGKIGPPLPLDKICAGIDQLVDAAESGKVAQAAEAMMTTDTRPKVAVEEAVIDGVPVRMVGVAKGAGMIEPNMATMLAYITTDAAVETPALQEALKAAVDKSFNRISIDGDRSTNDTVLALANGASGASMLIERAEAFGVFRKMLDKVCFELAMMIVHDGEGADRFVTVEVRGADSDQAADLAARSVANSLLNKTAWAGTHPDWGRIMDAIGYSAARVVEEKVDIFYDDVQAVDGGCRSLVPEETLIKVVSQSEFVIVIDLHLGRGSAIIYTCNCTEEYVRINY